jgi:hypothetical protein
MEVERGCERVGHTSRDLGSLLVAPRRGGDELLLDCLDVAVELHSDITLTSF